MDSTFLTASDSVNPKSVGLESVGLESVGLESVGVDSVGPDYVDPSSIGSAKGIQYVSHNMITWIVILVTSVTSAVVAAIITIFLGRPGRRLALQQLEAQGKKTKNEENREENKKKEKPEKEKLEKEKREREEYEREEREQRKKHQTGTKMTEELDGWRSVMDHVRKLGIELENSKETAAYCERRLEKRLAVLKEQINDLQVILDQSDSIQSEEPERQIGDAGSRARLRRGHSSSEID